MSKQACTAPKPSIFCITTPSLLHASYYPPQMKASPHLSSGPHPLPSARDASPSPISIVLKSRAHQQPLHPTVSTYAYISSFPKGNCSKPYLAINILLYLSPSLHLKKHFTLGSLLPHLLLLPWLCCLASTPLHAERSLTKVTSIAKSSGSL